MDEDEQRRNDERRQYDEVEAIRRKGQTREKRVRGKKVKAWEEMRREQRK